MIGKQVRFYMLPNDEQLFLQFLIEKLSCSFWGRSSATPKPHILGDKIGSATEHPELRSVLIWNAAFPLDKQDIRKALMKKYDAEKYAYIETGEVRYFIESSDAPVIEFSRSFIRDDGRLAKGRIWAGMYRLEGEALIRKEAAFVSWYDQVARWLRRHLKRFEGVDEYLGPAALEWHQAGGKLDG